jgi:nitrite reductase/ring-hydroxylating ferredoxin subunit
MTAMTTRHPWVPAFSLADVPVGEARLFAHGERRIAVFRTADDQAYALDDRCPHEGYPLVRGYVKDCVVTCIWHNFKFDVRDGRCVVGDEHARSYPLRIVDGRIELDLSDPDPAQELPRLYASLERGTCERKLGQIARDIVRLLQLGAPPADIAAAAARLDAEYAEYGTTHALPVACDTLTMAARYPGVHAVLPLIQAFDLASESNQRRPPRPVPDPRDPGPDPHAAGVALRAAVEAEDAALAESLLRGALARGWGRDVVEPWLYRLCTDHFLDFGHALIYQTKIFDLLERIGWSHAPALLPALLFRIVNGTREEQVPEWRWLCGRLADHAPQFPAWLARNAGKPRDPAAQAALHAALLDGDREEALAALGDALEAGAGLRNVADALVLAGAERLLRFDAAVDADPTVQEGWLDVTHRLTFARAVDVAVERHREPDVLRLFYFAAHFIHAGGPLDRSPDRRPAPVPVRAPTNPAVAAQAVLAAIRHHDPDDALALTAGYLAAGHPVDLLRTALEDATLRDPATSPIFVAHAIKTCVAAFEAHGALGGHPARDLPVLAFVRYFSCPAQERSLARLAHEAIGFIVHGKVPRTLT